MILGGCAVFASFLVPIPIRNPSLNYLFDWAHLLVFGFVAFALTHFMPIVSLWQRVLLAFGLAMSVGVLIEIIQPWFGRKSSLHDIKFNCVGGAIGIMLALAVRALVYARSRSSA